MYKENWWLSNAKGNLKLSQHKSRDKNFLCPVQIHAFRHHICGVSQQKRAYFPEYLHVEL